jgi:TatD DNase family protein
MQMIDTHCHLDLPVFDADREQVIAQAASQGVRRILVPGVQASGWDGLLRLCARHRGLYPALGLHPMFIEQHREEHLRTLEVLLARQRPLAIGEIGLDFFLKELDRERQTTLFERQLAIAKNAGLPVVLHVRKAHDQVLSLLRKHRIRGGIAHAFNGSLQQAGQYLDLGFKLGFGGMLTYPRSRKLHALARALPVEALVLETDAPDMSVAAHQGERNSPAYLPDCLSALARVRATDPALLARQTTLNALQVLGLDAAAESLEAPERTHDA